MHWRIVVLLVAFLGVACTGKGGGGPGAEGSKEDGFEGGIKADCFDCNPADLRSAFEQADLGRTGFLRKGTTWQVAWRFSRDTSFEKRVLGPDEARDRGALGDVHLFDYVVEEVTSRVFDQYKRPVARIRITQAVEAGPFAGLVTDERVDTSTYQIDLLMNDLFQGVAKVYYDERYPHGRHVEASQAARVRSGMDAFPADVPDVTVADTETRALPVLAPEMAAVATKAESVGWIDAGVLAGSHRYFAFEVSASGAASEEVWWSRGDLWPTFVRTSRGEGLLVRQLEP